MEEALIDQSQAMRYIVDSNTIYCRGDWTLQNIKQLKSSFKELDSSYEKVTAIDAVGISSLDSAGILLLLRMVSSCPGVDLSLQPLGLTSEFQILFDYVQQEDKKSKLQPFVVHKEPNAIYRLGVNVVTCYLSIVSFICFLGELFSEFFAIAAKPALLAWDCIFESIDSVGLRALPIVGLMSFLIGVVLAYQLSEQLRSYGADIFVVDITGVAILREFAPLITAIVMAGRTSTSFAALIGTMKVNEELDALSTMGVTPMSQLILPRVIAVIIIMPLLIVWADIFGILGSMIMSHALLKIPFPVFISRLHSSVGYMQYILGMIKAPAFALIIAGVGCIQGLSVEYSADSVGKKTTKAAVQAIFLVIIIDALFSIVFSILDL